MLRSDFARFGLGLETLLKSHNDHAAITGIMQTFAMELTGKYRLIEAIVRNAGD